MAEKSLKPEIRFAGFTEDWKQHKFDDLGSIAMNRRIFKYQTSANGEIPFYKIGTFGSTPDAYISRGLFEEYRAKYSYPEIGDILISASGSIGRTVEYTGKDEYFQDSNIVWLKHDERIENCFLKYFYSVVKWEGFEGSTIKRLYNRNILETKISLPSIVEQQKIGNFFNNLDNLITLHQCKCEKLVNFKKAMLEKMFPKDGADIPEIRFTGFTGAWEKHRFESICTRKVSYSNKSGLPRVEYEDIVPDVGELNKDIYQKENSKPGIQFDTGDILFGKLRPYLKNWIFSKFKGIAVGDFWILRSAEADNKFIYYLIQSTTFQEVVNQTSGTKMPRADWNLVSKSSFFIPTDIAEQHKIGVLFTHIDNLITLHQRELEKLKNIKKAMLDKMFV